MLPSESYCVMDEELVEEADGLTQTGVKDLMKFLFSR